MDEVSGVPHPLFGCWLRETQRLQVESFGRDEVALKSDPVLLADTVQKQAGYMIWEIGEMMAEYPGCKDWVVDRSALNRDAFLNEAVDVLHFFANVLTALEFTDEDLTRAYYAKMQRNRERMASGIYDGVSSKCSSCHRDYTDEGVECYPIYGSRIINGWCDVEGGYI